MFDWLRSVFRRSSTAGTPALPPVVPALPAPAAGDGEGSETAVPVTALGPYWGGSSVQSRLDDGSKFPGGFGATYILTADYWTLRLRSKQLFETNLYARGIIRRLITNEINTGLHLEAMPEEKVLGFGEDGLAEWTEDVEVRFSLWAQTPWLCDHQEQRTFGALQRAIRMAALIEGDVLVMRRQDPRTGLPRIQIISGSNVRSPLTVAPRKGNRIEHGVEFDKTGRHVAFWVFHPDGKFKRIPAWGERSGRRIAWLVYGTEVLLDDVRGKPILSLVLQSLREIDRYRDSTQRKAVINSMLAMFIKKGEDKPGTLAMGGGAVRLGTETAVQQDGTERSFRVADHIPGIVIEELQHGEEPKAFVTSGTTEEFGKFEEAIIQAFAWANEIPPEVMRLAFSNNYSASQAAINEFKMYLNKVRTDFGETVCAPIYVEWLIASSIERKVVADQLLAAWRDASMHDVFAAWVAGDWSGHIKPAVDLSKLVRGYVEQIEAGLMTRDRAARELNGMKYSKVVQRLRLENEQLAAARAPLAEDEESEPSPPTSEPTDDNDGDDEDQVDDDTKSDQDDEESERAA